MFRNKSGWLAVSEARLEMTFTTWRRSLVACITDEGEIVSGKLATDLIGAPMSLPNVAEEPPPDDLDAIIDDLYWDFLGETDLQNLAWLDDAMERAEDLIRKLQLRCDHVDRMIGAKLRSLRAQRRVVPPGPEALAIDQKVVRFEEASGQLARAARRRAEETRRATDSIAAEIFDAQKDHGELERLYTIAWRARSWRNELQVQLPLEQESHYWTIIRPVAPPMQGALPAQPENATGRGESRQSRSQIEQELFDLLHSRAGKSP